MMRKLHNVFAICSEEIVSKQNPQIVLNQKICCSTPNKSEFNEFMPLILRLVGCTQFYCHFSGFLIDYNILNLFVFMQQELIRVNVDEGISISICK